MGSRKEAGSVNVTAEDIGFLEMACRLAEDNVDNGGGPFGAVIVRDGNVVATGVNTVTLSCDPTAHAEVNAVRAACAREKAFTLGGCVVYSSCEPCPMCLSALYWAGVRRVYYGNTKEDAEVINFSDSFIYREIRRRPLNRAIPFVHVDTPFGIKAFEKWAAKDDKVTY